MIPLIVIIFDVGQALLNAKNVYTTSAKKDENYWSFFIRTTYSHVLTNRTEIFTSFTRSYDLFLMRLFLILSKIEKLPVNVWFQQDREPPHYVLNERIKHS